MADEGIIGKMEGLSKVVNISYQKGLIDKHQFIVLHMNPNDLTEKFPESDFYKDFKTKSGGRVALQGKYFDDIRDFNGYALAFDNPNFFIRGFVFDNKSYRVLGTTPNSI